MNDLLTAVPEVFLGKHVLDRRTPLLGREFKPEGYDPALVAIASINNLIWLIRAAQQTAPQALSWRDYKVGSAVLAYDFETPAMGITVGMNIKPDQDGSINLHAEQLALAKARRMKLNHVMAIAVWGDPTDANANPSGESTLRPCRRCDDMLRAIPEVKTETLILSGNSDLSVCELYTAMELQTFYSSPEAQGNISSIPYYSLAENMDDDAYTTDIFLPHLLPKVRSLYPNSLIAPH